jgi:hypothetical protein
MSHPTQQQQPHTPFTYEPQHTKARPPVWPWLVAIVVAIAATAGITLALTSNTDGDSPTTTSPFALKDQDKTPLRQAFTECHTGDLGDQDHTLVIDMSGEDPGSGAASLDGFTCVLTHLDTPQSVISKMNSTRALDGMQSATWANFEASWTYHPDDGLDLIITQN